MADADKQQFLTSETHRTWLKVPYPDKERARALGAQYDWKAKRWYVPAGVDAAPLARWREAPQGVAPRLSETAILAQFGEALKAAGLILDGSPLMDGQWHRVPVATSRNARALKGSYIGHLDTEKPNGFIQNHDTGEKQPWSMRGVQLDAAARQAAAARLAGERAARDAALRAEQEAVAAQVAARWDKLPPAARHPYLANKQVDAFGLKLDGARLLIPMRDAEGRLWNVQSIDADKRFAKGGRKTGTFHVIGDLASAATVLVAEGYATAASLHMATRLPVVVAFDSGNLDAVLAALKPRLADKEVVICGDDDRLHPDKMLRTLNQLVQAPHARDGLQVAAIGAAALKPDAGPQPLAANAACTLELKQSHTAEGVRRYGGELRNRDTGARVPVLLTNVGEEKARAAAAAHGAKVLFPNFAASADKATTDFNDLQVREGLHQVRLQVGQVVEKTPLLARTPQELARQALGEAAQVQAPRANGRYSGPVIGHTPAHAVQDVGRQTAVAHALEKLDRVPAAGAPARIDYQDGRGIVSAPGRDRAGPEPER